MSSDLPGYHLAGHDDDPAGEPDAPSAAPDPFASPQGPVTSDEQPGAPAATDEEEAAVSPQKSSRRAFWKELPVLIAVALVVAVIIKTFLVQAFFIPSASMRDTLLEGDRVMVNKLAFRFGDPGHGDVIVFDSPLREPGDGENILEAVVRNIGEALGLSTPESALIKRVIAVGGDTVEIQNNTLLVNGLAVDEPYLTRTPRMFDFGPVEVPPGHVFVMGDNRNQSEDSRSFGPIPESTIIGRAFIKVWPPGRWGGL